MVIVFGENTILNVDKVISLLIKYTPQEERTKTSSGFFGLFPTYETTKRDEWTLEFQYTGGVVGNMEYTYTSRSSNYQRLVEQAKQIILQIKKYDNTIIDQAFEDAFLKGVTWLL